MDSDSFATSIDDFLAFRWNMNIREGENRYDALVRGMELLPPKKVIKFRNQQLPQTSGFDCEPVMKFLFNINQVPIELQILGGRIEAYMSAKGYADYKTKLKFHPQKDSLTEKQWNARLGTCIYQSEIDESNNNQDLMLKELLGEKIIYDEAYSFAVDYAPALSENRRKLISFMKQFA
ncbi:MAG: hypothetical protein NXI01_08010 [Gammaproteobacteria bacterium]|nr:hypothetical protein [Gammaproteobacteria bacterium]